MVNSQFFGEFLLTGRWGWGNFESECIGLNKKRICVLNVVSLRIISYRFYFYLKYKFYKIWTYLHKSFLLGSRAELFLLLTQSLFLGHARSPSAFVMMVSMSSKLYLLGTFHLLFFSATTLCKEEQWPPAVE